MSARVVASTLDTKAKVTYVQDLELVVVRWRYLLRSPNPAPARMAEFESVLRGATAKAWSRFRYAYSTLGYDFDDVLSLSRIYLVSFLGLFSLREHPSRLASFAEAFEKKRGHAPDDDDVARKEKSNLSDFLRQRLEEAAKVCSQKNRNIRGTDRVVAAVLGPTRTDASDQELLCNAEGHGYERISLAERERLAKGDPALLQSREFVCAAGVVRLLDVPPRELTAVDLEGATAHPDPRDVEHREEYESFVEGFFEDPDSARDMLLEFVRRHGDDPSKADMVSAAARMARGGKAMERARTLLGVG